MFVLDLVVANDTNNSSIVSLSELDSTEVSVNNNVELLDVIDVLNANKVLEFHESLKQGNFSSGLQILENCYKALSLFNINNSLQFYEQVLSDHLFSLLYLPIDDNIWKAKMYKKKNENHNLNQFYSIDLEIPILLEYIIDLTAFLRMFVFLSCLFGQDASR